MLCALIFFIHERWDQQFKVDLERQIFEKLFMAILFLFSEFLIGICRDEVTEERFCHISFSWRCRTWGLNRGLMSNKPTHYLLDHGRLPFFPFLFFFFTCCNYYIFKFSWVSFFTHSHLYTAHHFTALHLI